MQDNNQRDQAPAPFPIVGLGASAGGLEAINAFFDAMPPNNGLAFVVVQHLASHQESILHQLIQRHTPLPVERIMDGMLVQPNHIYVLPEGHEVTIYDNVLHLTPRPESKGWPDTINRFFESLALNSGEKAAAVILSGAGHDGTDGARAIHNSGGLVMAEDLETAAQSSMPFNVINAGLAAVVLLADQMPSYLLSHFEVSLPEPSTLEELADSLSDDDVKRVIRQLRRETNYDFTEYKLSTLRRQIARRMGTHQIKGVDAYLSLLENQTAEARQLAKGLLIHVTSFFRDPDAFEALKIKALQPLLQTLTIDDVLRVWVPGCASGEEAVSIAILIYECLRELMMPEMDVRVFASDVSRELIQRARGGLYPASIAQDIDPVRLKDHFVKTDDGYQVRAHISRMIVWTDHNLIEHPPFSNLHLISCRNVMIYFQPKLQERLRALFQFALRSNGILFLGSSEALPGDSDLFTVIDSKSRLYRRTGRLASPWMRLDQPLLPRGSDHTEEALIRPKPLQPRSDDQKLRLIKEMLLTHYNSACVIVDERYLVRYIYGDIDPYLRLIPGGDGPASLLNMAGEGLDAELTIALYQAFDGDQTIVRQGVWIKTHGTERLINLIVKPIDEGSDGSTDRLVIFEPAPTTSLLTQTADKGLSSEEGATVTQLRDDLQQTRRALQSATQALQAKSEELTSSIEEISSASEELQTTNEELRTSKEELESLNEELNTLNTQLSNQNYELTHAHNALYNFLQSTAIAVIFLDQTLAVREYTQAAMQLFSLRKTDIGRPIAELTSQLAYDNLLDHATQVLDTLSILEDEVTTIAGDWYRVEVRPYRMVNNVVDGVVLTFNNITLQKQAQHKAEQTAVYVRKVVDTFESSVLELDSDLRVTAANTAFYQVFQTTPDETLGTLLYNLGNGQWNIPELRRLLQEVIPQQVFIRDYRVTHDFPQIGLRTLHLNAHQIQEVDRILLVITDLSTPDTL